MASGLTGNSPFDVFSYLLFVIYGVVILSITTCFEGATNTCTYLLQRTINAVFYPFNVAQAGIVGLYASATSVCRQVYHLNVDTWSFCTGPFTASVIFCQKAFLTTYDPSCRLLSLTVADAKSVRIFAWQFCCSATAAVLGMPGQTFRTICRAVLTPAYLISTASSCVKMTLHQLLLSVLPDSFTCTFAALHHLSKRFWRKSQSRDSHQVFLLYSLPP